MSYLDVRKSSQSLHSKYADKEAAIEVYGSALFLVYFDYGESKDHWYWNYHAHMVCQLQDCVDGLKIQQPTYHFAYLFDQSSGHSKQPLDGLNASLMNMRETKKKHDQDTWELEIQF